MSCLVIVKLYRNHMNLMGKKSRCCSKVNFFSHFDGAAPPAPHGPPGCAATHQSRDRCRGRPHASRSSLNFPPTTPIVTVDSDLSRDFTSLIAGAASGMLPPALRLLVVRLGDPRPPSLQDTSRLDSGSYSESEGIHLKLNLLASDSEPESPTPTPPGPADSALTLSPRSR